MNYSARPEAHQGLAIRAADQRDGAALDWLLRAAFGQAEEADLVRRLERDGDVVLSLVALRAGQMIGQVLFSALALEGEGQSVVAAALAPLAVHPDHQSRGIGGALVRAGLELCRSRGIEVVIVLGDPAYYGRFGFSAALADALEAPFSGPAFMALELRPGALEGVRAKVRYAGAFGLDSKESFET